MKSLTKVYRLSTTEAMQALNTSMHGLTSAEAAERLKRFGPNTLQAKKPVSWWTILLRQLKSAVVLLLAAAAAAAFAFGELLQCGAVTLVLILNTLIGFCMELSGVRSMESLVRVGEAQTRVRRDGRLLKVPSLDLVPGDLVLLDEGDSITADLRIVEASRLESDESSLTGESLPAPKMHGALHHDAEVAARNNMLFKGCVITRGTGKAIVIATGMNTELGMITALVKEAKEEVTPLERRLEQLGSQLIWLILAVAGIVALLGIVRGYPILTMVEVAIALTVAAIPEGLPVVATIALSRGLLRMAREKGLVRQLSSVETLGSTTVICTDKTGTLTENRMVATQVLYSGGETERNDQGIWNPLLSSQEVPLYALLRCAGLCSNAVYEQGVMHGDPTETALLHACTEIGLDVAALRAQYPEVGKEAFDSVVKMMATYHGTQEGPLLVAVKGAPEAVLHACHSLDPTTRQYWQQRNDSLAAQGFRVLAFAQKSARAVSADPYTHLEFLGLIALYDPPRAEVKETIARCRAAGIRIVMVTGDQAPTALYVAKQLGIINSDDVTYATSHDFTHDKAKVLAANVITRVTPKEKLELVTWHQQSGEIVAMTGDGVNDAPALKKADIGVAMGVRGTDVAREAADIVLLDDAFDTIVKAIAEGRTIFENIRDFVRYLLSCNLAEVLVIFFASLGNFPLPILPLQILFLNLVTDVFPALALGLGESDGRHLLRPPRSPKEPMLNQRVWRGIVLHGLLLTGATLGALGFAFEVLGFDARQAVTISFLTLGFTQMWHVVNMRDPDERLLRNRITSNPSMWAALSVCTILLLATVHLPGLATVLQTAPIGTSGWAIVIGFSFLPIVVDSAFRLVAPQILFGKRRFPG